MNVQIKLDLCKLFFPRTSFTQVHRRELNSCFFQRYGGKKGRRKESEECWILLCLCSAVGESKACAGEVTRTDTLFKDLTAKSKESYPSALWGVWSKIVLPRWMPRNDELHLNNKHKKNNSLCSMTWRLRRRPKKKKKRRGEKGKNTVFSRALTHHGFSERFLLLLPLVLAAVRQRDDDTAVDRVAADVQGGHPRGWGESKAFRVESFSMSLSGGRGPSCLKERGRKQVTKGHLLRSANVSPQHRSPLGQAEKGDKCRFAIRGQRVVSPRSPEPPWIAPLGATHVK